MAVVTRASGTQSGATVGTTTTTLATIAEPGEYELVVDTTNMVNGDELELSVEEKALSGSSYAVADKGNWVNVQENKIIRSGFFLTDVAVQFKLKQQAGTARNFDWSVRERTPDNCVRKNTAQAGATGSITFDSGASATDSLYNGQYVSIIAGTGVGQTRRISAYVGSTKVATVTPNWTTNPASGSVFMISFGGYVDVGYFGGTAQSSGIDVSNTIGVIYNLLDTEIAAILAAVDTEVAAIKAKTDQLTFTAANQVDAQVLSMATDSITSGALSAGAGTEIADAVIGRTLGTEGYAADGSVPTLREMMYMLWSAIAQFDITGTSLISRKLNGTDQAMGFTLDDASNPTARSRTA